MKDSCQQERVSVVQLYKNVLYERESRGGVTMVQSESQSSGHVPTGEKSFGLFLLQRKMLADGVSTAPLDITLRHCSSGHKRSKRGRGPRVLLVTLTLVMGLK